MKAYCGLFFLLIFYSVAATPEVLTDSQKKMIRFLVTKTFSFAYYQVQVTQEYRKLVKNFLSHESIQFSAIDPEAVAQSVAYIRRYSGIKPQKEYENEPESIQKDASPYIDELIRLISEKDGQKTS